MAEAYTAAWNAHDLPAVLALFAPDAVVRERGGRCRPPCGTPATRRWCAPTWTGSTTAQLRHGGLVWVTGRAGDRGLGGGALRAALPPRGGRVPRRRGRGGLVVPGVRRPLPAGAGRRPGRGRRGSGGARRPDRGAQPRPVARVRAAAVGRGERGRGPGGGDPVRRPLGDGPSLPLSGPPRRAPPNRPARRPSCGWATRRATTRQRWAAQAPTWAGWPRGTRSRPASASRRRPTTRWPRTAPRCRLRCAGGARRLAALAQRCGLAAPAVAVRSSALDEDGGTASFAGQHETILNVTGADALEDAIVRCWRSLDAERARAYRAHHGLGDEGARLAVLVQQLVPASPPGWSSARTPSPTGATRRSSPPATAWGKPRGRDRHPRHVRRAHGRSQAIRRSSAASSARRR